MTGERRDIVALISDHRARIVRGTALFVVAMAVLSFLAESFDFPGHTVVGRLSGLTTVRSLATWTTTIVLFAAGLLSFLAASLDTSRARYWVLAGVAAVALSAEEIVGLHEFDEPVARPVDPFAARPGLIWPALAVALFVVAFLVARRFLRSLPRAVGARLVTAGVLVATGAIGLQYLGEIVAFSNGIDNSAFIAIHTLEETTELAGFVVGFDAIARHLSSFAVGVDQDL